MNDSESPAPAPRRSLPRRLVRLLLSALLILALTLVLFVLAVEVGLRYVRVSGLSREELSPEYLDSEEKHRNQPHPYLAYSLKPGWRSAPTAEFETAHNQLGYRGPETSWRKPEGVLRILCLGGSSTYGHTPSTNEATWPARLQHHLSEARPDRAVEVVNCGASGWSTFESLINLAIRGVDQRPDLVVVYHSINDMRCALYDPRPQPDNTHWRAVWPVYRPSPMEGTLESSMAYLIWRHRFTDYLEMRADLGFYAIVDYAERDANDPDFYDGEISDRRGFSSFQRNLVSLVALARAHGARVLFATQGMDASDLDGAASKENQLRALQEMTQILRYVAEERGVPLVEAAAVLEAEAARQRREAAAHGDPAPANPQEDQTIFSHEVHLWDEGADLLARTLAEGILAHGLLD